MNYKNIPIADCHTHTFWNFSLSEKENLLLSLMEKFNYDSVTILPIPFNAYRKSRSRDFTENLTGFYFKSKYPDKIFSFAGLSPSYDDTKNTPEFFLEQAKFYMEAGFDGIKMIEGRPNQFHVCGRYKDPKYDLVYKFAEEEQIPLTVHTSGPEKIWKEGGSKFGQKPDWMDYYTEMDEILSKYPKLRINLAHLFFSSERIELASEFLDKYENVYYDICPNQFMYLDFQKKPDEWKQFFIKYQDRLMYGTDIGATTTDFEGKEAESLVYMVRGFFEEDKPYTSLGYDFTPIPLDDSILRKIYKENMLKFYNREKPLKANPEVMRKELEFVKKLRVFLNLQDVKNLELIETVF